MKYILDTDAISILYDEKRKPHHEAIHQRLSQLDDEDVLQTSALVVCELEYSFANAPEEKQGTIRRAIDSILDDFDAIIPADVQLASIYGSLKARLKEERRLSRAAMRKHNIDLLLASTAIGTSSVLIGMDSIFRDIAKINGEFKFENWLGA